MILRPCIAWSQEWNIWHLIQTYFPFNQTILWAVERPTGSCSYETCCTSIGTMAVWHRMVKKKPFLMFHFSCLLKWGTALILWSNANSNWGNNQLLQKPGPENMESQNTAIVSIKRCPKEPLNHCTAGSLRNLNRIPASNKSGICLLSCKYVGLARAFGIPLNLCVDAKQRPLLFSCWA